MIKRVWLLAEMRCAQTTMNFVSGMPALFGYAMYTGGRYENCGQDSRTFI